MTSKPLANLVFLFVILAVLYFISNKISESFEVISNEEKDIHGTKACSRDAANKSILHYIFTRRLSAR